MRNPVRCLDTLSHRQSQPLNLNMGKSWADLPDRDDPQVGKYIEETNHPCRTHHPPLNEPNGHQERQVTKSANGVQERPDGARKEIQMGPVSGGQIRRFGKPPDSVGFLINKRIKSEHFWVPGAPGPIWAVSGPVRGTPWTGRFRRPNDGRRDHGRRYARRASRS